ncbi:hypothetical protein GCM10022381_20760 [Leifsonia kafniensis]|uniref:Cardiolipin synthase N-terminal domain-containing protein n=1 Tax=Leifsonia kafniensis TaxID=475957 RepID=A0ABP7KKN5_9MICO
MDVAALFVFLLVAVVAAAYLGAIVYALMQIMRSPDLVDVEKLVWVIGVIAAPFIGALVWYFLGPHPFGLRLSRDLR